MITRKCNMCIVHKLHVDGFREWLFHRWDISVICPIVLLELAVTVFTFSVIMTEMTQHFSVI